jgi:hypothetical protein
LGATELRGAKHFVLVAAYTAVIVTTARLELNLWLELNLFEKTTAILNPEICTSQPNPWALLLQDHLAVDA